MVDGDDGGWWAVMMAMVALGVGWWVVGGWALGIERRN